MKGRQHMRQQKKAKPEQKKSRFEFSKRLVIWTSGAFWTQVFVTMILIFCKSEASEPLVAILATTATLAGAVVVGYFGKAGVENYQKINTASNGNEDEDTDMEGKG